MTDSRPGRAPGRVVLDGVPKVRYIKDGLCPFVLCLKSCADFLGSDYAYDYILGASGACFRMSWNFTRWDAGNMDLGRLGPEPFRRGLRAVGLKHRFLLKKPWWPDQTGSDIEAMDDNQATEAAFRQEIIASIRAGRPVLAFGVVGPPEVSIVTGYDQGGEVLIGWSCFQGDHPKDQLEPNGAFRQREWFANTQGLILIEGKPEAVDVDAVHREAIEWAYCVSTLAKSKTHCFGGAAHKDWAEGMLKDAAFPHDDEKTLQSRRYTVWDGLIMLAERGSAAEFLEKAAKRRPDVAEPLREAARLFRAEGECGGAVTKALGGHTLPSKHLADPTARRTAADFILQARDRSAEALVHLAKVVGKEYGGGFVFDGKELAGLRPARRWMTLLGCLKGCMRHVGRDVDDAWLYGVTGAAFMLNIDKNVDVSGPTSWDATHLRKMAPHLGISLSNQVRGAKADPDLDEKQKAAAAFVKQKVDAGLPCYGWDGCMEFFTVNGYDDEGWLEWSHYYEGGYKHKPRAKLGHNITEVFYVVSVEPVDVAASDRAIVKEALQFALAQRPTGKPLRVNNAQGLQAYDLWIRCLESGDWLQASPPGVHHNLACWHECRCYAERFLRLAGERLGGDLKPLFDQAADHYRVTRTALGKMQAIFPYKYPQPPVDKAGIARGVALLRTAKEAETEGLAVIERIVRKLSGATTRQGDKELKR